MYCGLSRGMKGSQIQGNSPWEHPDNKFYNNMECAVVIPGKGNPP
jgi:hypothetical protein